MSEGLFDSTDARPKRPRRAPRAARPRAEPEVVKRTLGGAISRRLRSSKGYMFEAYVLATLDRVPVPGYGTCGVTFVDRRPTLFYDPEFIARICEEELDLTMRHEVLHLTLHHITRGATLRRIYNYDGVDARDQALQRRAHGLAADWVVNEIMAEDNSKMGRDDRPLGYWAFATEFGLPMGKSYEEYFADALRILRQRQAEQDAERERRKARGQAGRGEGRGAAGEESDDGDDGEPGEGEPGDDEDEGELGEGEGELGEGEGELGEGEGELGEGEGEPENEDLDADAAPDLSNLKLVRPENIDALLYAYDVLEALAVAEASKNEARERPDEDVGDWHTGPLVPVDPPSHAELTYTVDQLLKDAAAQAEEAGGKPNDAYVHALKPHTAPLTGLEALYAALDGIVATDGGRSAYRSSMQHLNRAAAARMAHARRAGAVYTDPALRMPLVPGYTAETQLGAVVVLDTSGSMYDSLLNYGIAVVQDVLRTLNIQSCGLLECDYRCVRAITLEQNGELPADVVGRGCTDFDPGLRGAVEWAASNGKQLDVIIYITDGDAARPQVRVSVPTVWALVGRCKRVLEDVPGNYNVVLRHG